MFRDGTDQISVDQRQGSGQWHLLGEYPLTADSRITLSSQADGYVIADAVRIQGRASQSQANTLSYYHNAHLGAPRLLTDREQRIVWEGRYRPFGEVQLATEGMDNNLRFPGQGWKTGSGLVENGVRSCNQAYPPVSTRWTAHPNRASNATYRIHHASGITEVSVDQQHNGGQWHRLGTYTLDGASHVELTDQANGYVIADAIAVAPSGSDGSQATWTHLVEAPGRYRVQARWTAQSNRASNARYTIEHRDGTDQISVDQRQGGGQWHLLDEYPLTADSRITLSSQADGYVIADTVRIQGRASQSQANTLSYYHNDHLGAPRLLTDREQRIVWDGRYRPFGEVQLATEGMDNNLRFPGQYFDVETGFYYNYFRYYDPSTGRNITSDPSPYTQITRYLPTPALAGYRKCSLVCAEGPSRCSLRPVLHHSSLPESHLVWRYSGVRRSMAVCLEARADH